MVWINSHISPAMMDVFFRCTRRPEARTRRCTAPATAATMGKQSEAEAAEEEDWEEAEEEARMGKQSGEEDSGRDADHSQKSTSTR